MDKTKGENMNAQTQLRIGKFWESIEALYTSNELTESQYLELARLLAEIITAENDKVASQC